MPVFTAIAGVVSAISAFTIGGVAVGSMLLQTAVGIGLNLIAQAIAGKPPKPTFAINGTLQAGGDVPRSFIVGRYATAGSLTWANTWGKVSDTPNAFLTQVISVSDLPVGGLVEVWCNGEKCTLLTDEPHPDGRGYPVQQYRKSGSDSLWIKFYDGTQTEADSFLTTGASTASRVYEATRVGYGVAYAIATSKIAKNMFSGFPSFKFVLDGVRFYDITKDDTAGGEGDQRFSDPSTWGGDGDHLPAVQAYNLLRGLTWNGEWFYGLQGLGAARLPAANWNAQVAKCRAAIEGGSGDEPSYRCAGEITIDAPLSAAFEAINTSCQGRISEVGGVYSMFLGAPDAPSFSFSDDDILSTEEQSFTPFFGLADTINGIAATYPSPKAGWAMKPAPSLYRTDLEARHGNRRLMADIELPFVPYPEQVQRLMTSALAEGQRARRHTHVLPPEFWAYAEPGEIWIWNSARNGYSTKAFRIDGVIDLANLDVMVDLTEVDPADYNWNSDTDYQPPVDGPVGPIRPQPQPIVDWFAEPASIKDNAGVDRRPAIRLTWDNTEGRLDDVVGIEFEVRLASDFTTVYGGRTDQPEVGSLLISQGLLPNVTYGVRGRYIPGSDREASWSNWLPVITPNILISDVLVDLGAIAEEIGGTLQQLYVYMDEVRATLEQIAAASAEGIGATISQEAVAVRYRSATAVAMSQLSASITAIDGQLTAQAEALTAVAASIDDASAEGLFRLTAEAGSGDVVARAVAQVRATLADDWIAAGWIIEAGFTAGLPFSRFIINASQLVVSDGINGAVPFAIEDGVVKLQVGRIGSAVIDQLATSNGKLTINGAGTNSDISIRT